MQSLILYISLDSYTLFHNSKLLEFDFKLSDLPHESILDLQELSTYPPIKDLVIYIRSLTGETLDFPVTEDTFIITVKELIYKATGIPPDYQRLLFAGNALNDQKSLYEYKIANESTLHLILTLKGGGGPQTFVHNAMENQIIVQFSTLGDA